MADTTAGKLLAGRYRLERELGRGGMGAVWAGQDEKLRRPVAVKVMTERIAESESAVQRFEREAMAVARLRSPYIVEVHDYGVDEGCPFIVMELLEGEDLKTLLEREKRLSVEDTAKLVVQVAKALHAAHLAGIVHRDLKPANIFLAREHDDVTAKVFDFGVAKALTDLGDGSDSDMTGEGVLLGTPRFMSPEQAYGAKRVDHRSDLWSLAVIAYNCITGRPPFIAPGTGHVLVMICTEDPPRPSELIPHLPPEVDAFFEEALAKEPDHRFQSARELCTAFAGLADVSLSAIGLSVTEPQPSWTSSPSLAAPSDPNAVTRNEGSAANGDAQLTSSPSISYRDGAATSTDGTLGAATTSLGGRRGFLGSSWGRLAMVAAAALVVGAGAWAAFGRGAGSPAPASAASAATGAPPIGVGASPPEPAGAESDPARTTAAGASAPAPETATSSATKRGTRRAHGGAGAAAENVAPTAQPAAAPSGAAAGRTADTPKDAPPAKTAATPSAQPTKPKSDDGLDLFNKRW